MILESASQLPYFPKRIISVVPSQTELLHYLGLEAETIGITKFCVRPTEWFRKKHRIGGTKTIDVNRIRELQPDLIIANKEENVQEQVLLLARDFNVWVTDVKDLESALGMISDIGKLTNKGNAAQRLLKEIEERFLSIGNLANRNRKLRTAYLIWRTPYMVAGVDTYISNMLQFAGLTNAFSNKTRYPEITIADLKNEQCELILLSSEPYPFKQNHISELQERLPGTKIMLVDGEMFSWYGSRLLEVPGYLKRMMSFNS